jgi:hypothetical protein
MEISGAGPIFLFGCLGGIAIELLRWWKLRESIEFPVYARKWTYWFLTIAMILAGGLIAVAYGTDPKSALLAMNLGASTPAIIGTLAAQSKTGANERSFSGPRPGRARLRNFIAFGR